MNALLALFTRSIRELLRSRLSYLACGAVIGIIFLLLLGAQAGATATTAPGLKFFESVLIVVLVFITLAGVSYFATAGHGGEGRGDSWFAADDRSRSARHPSR
jgi:hypothetical protein